MIEVIALIVIFCIPLIVVFIKNTLWDLYFWQIKEYRWDRFWTHIRWDLNKINRNTNIIGIKFILFSATSLLFIAPLIGIFAVLLTYVLWTYESFDFVTQVKKRDFVRPSLKNPRNWIIIFGMLSALIFLIMLITGPFIDIDRNVISDTSMNINSLGNNIELFPVTDMFVMLGLLSIAGLILDLASPITIILFVILTQPLALAKRWRTVRKAKIKLSQLNPKLVIIGITGSQGKTTTKELVYELLKDKYKTVKTPENYNTDVGVAGTVLTLLNKDTEVFVAEMGAYRKGEIAGIAKAFPPDISVITDVDTQHIGIFGSKQKLVNAKYELVDHMKTNGTAILNGENEKLVEKGIKEDSRVVFTAYHKKYLGKLKKLVDPKTDYLVSNKTNISHTNQTIVVHGQDIEEEIKINGIPETYIPNVTQAIAVASELNVSFDQMKKTLEKFEKKLPRLQADSGDNGTIVINDSYSSSRKGFISAIKEMKKYQKEGAKNIVITKGILELGKHKAEVYDEIMDEVAKDINVLITTDHQLAVAAKNDNEHIDIRQSKSNNEIVYNFRNVSRKGDVVLLEGRLHPDIISEIISEDNEGKL